MSFAGVIIALSVFPGLGARSARAENPVLHEPPIPFTWQLNAADEGRLTAQVKTLRYGDSLMLVKAKLGAPTEEGDFADKLGRHQRRQLTYAIRRVRPQGGNTYDQEISLIFGAESHRLLQIWYTNTAPLGGDIDQIHNTPGTSEIHGYLTKPPMP